MLSVQLDKLVDNIATVPFYPGNESREARAMARSYSEILPEIATFRIGS